MYCSMEVEWFLILLLKLSLLNQKVIIMSVASIIAVSLSWLYKNRQGQGLGT